MQLANCELTELKPRNKLSWNIVNSMYVGWKGEAVLKVFFACGTFTWSESSGSQILMHTWFLFIMPLILGIRGERTEIS